MSGKKDHLIRQSAPPQAHNAGEDGASPATVPPNDAARRVGATDDDQESTSQMNGERPLVRTPAQPRGMLDRSLQAQLGRQLRAIFSDVAEEPVPDRFVKLLEALEAKEKRR